jgi:rubrerythrin
MENTTASGHTEKEIIGLKDQLEAESLTIKKLMDYKININDPELSKMVDDMIDQHKSHYNRLLSHIK